MFRNVFAVLFIAAMALTSCSGSTTPQTDGSSTASESSAPPVETTVLIDGKEWTCAQITASTPEKCSPLTQRAFDAYKENIDAYVNSGRLGPLLNNGDKFTYEDAAFAGLVACAYILDGRNQSDYISFMKKTPPFEETSQNRGVMYLPAWFEAPKSLCTDLKTPNQNPGSSVIP